MFGNPELNQSLLSAAAETKLVPSPTVTITYASPASVQNSQEEEKPEILTLKEAEDKARETAEAIYKRVKEQAAAMLIRRFHTEKEVKENLPNLNQITSIDQAIKNYDALLKQANKRATQAAKNAKRETTKKIEKAIELINGDNNNEAKTNDLLATINSAKDKTIQTAQKKARKAERAKLEHTSNWITQVEVQDDDTIKVTVKLKPFSYKLKIGENNDIISDVFHLASAEDQEDSSKRVAKELSFLIASNEDFDQRLKEEIQDAYNTTINPKKSCCYNFWFYSLQTFIFLGQVFELFYFFFTLATLAKSVLGKDTVFGSENVSNDVKGFIEGFGGPAPNSTSTALDNGITYGGALPIALVDLWANIDAVNPEKNAKDIINLWLTTSTKFRVGVLTPNLLSYFIGGFGDFAGIYDFADLFFDGLSKTNFVLWGIITLFATAAYYSGFHATKVTWAQENLSLSKLWQSGKEMTNCKYKWMGGLSFICYLIKDFLMTAFIRCTSFAFLALLGAQMFDATWGTNIYSAKTFVAIFGASVTLFQVTTAYTKNVVTALYVDTKKENGTASTMDRFKEFKEKAEFDRCSTGNFVKNGFTALLSGFGVLSLASYFFGKGIIADSSRFSKSLGFLFTFDALAITGVAVMLWIYNWKKHEDEFALFKDVQNLKENTDAIAAYLIDKKHLFPKGYPSLITRIRESGKQLDALIRQDEANPSNVTQQKIKRIAIQREELIKIADKMRNAIASFRDLKTTISNTQDDTVLGAKTYALLDYLEEQYDAAAAEHIAIKDGGLRVPGETYKKFNKFKPSFKASGTTIARQINLYRFVLTVAGLAAAFKDKPYLDNFVLTSSVVIMANFMPTFMIFYSDFKEGALALNIEEVKDTANSLSKAYWSGAMGSSTNGVFNWAGRRWTLFWYSSAKKPKRARETEMTQMGNYHPLLGNNV